MLVSFYKCLVSIIGVGIGIRIKLCYKVIRKLISKVWSIFLSFSICLKILTNLFPNQTTNLPKTEGKVFLMNNSTKSKQQVNSTK